MPLRRLQKLYSEENVSQEKGLQEKVNKVTEILNQPKETIKQEQPKTEEAFQSVSNKKIETTSEKLTIKPQESIEDIKNHQLQKAIEENLRNKEEFEEFIKSGSFQREYGEILEELKNTKDELNTTNDKGKIVLPEEGTFDAANRINDELNRQIRNYKNNIEKMIEEGKQKNTQLDISEADVQSLSTIKELHEIEEQSLTLKEDILNKKK